MLGSICTKEELQALPPPMSWMYNVRVVYNRYRRTLPEVGNQIQVGKVYRYIFG